MLSSIEGIELGFYALGFVTCLLLIAIITEVLDREERAQKKSKSITKEIRKQLTIKNNREKSKIDVD